MVEEVATAMGGPSVDVVTADVSPEVDLAGFAVTPHLRFRTSLEGTGAPLILEQRWDHHEGGQVWIDVPFW